VVALPTETIGRLRKDIDVKAFLKMGVWLLFCAALSLGIALLPMIVGPYVVSYRGEYVDLIAGSASLISITSGITLGILAIDFAEMDPKDPTDTPWRAAWRRTKKLGRRVSRLFFLRNFS
jgi:hypothetical protein